MLGPVFAREIVGTARKGRSYALRSVYSLALLAVLIASYHKAFGTDLVPRSLSDTQITTFTHELFWHLVLVQGIVVVVLTPALVAGAIAGEVQRKTLGDLLTSDLSAVEIVLGKLAARLIHLGSLLAAGLPILLLTGLLGGLDPRLVLASVAATLSTAFFLGGLAILGSIQTRSVRGAMNFVFTLTLTWLVLPGAIDVVLPHKGELGLRLYEWFGPINAWVAPTSPFALLVDVLRGSIRSSDALSGRIVAMIGLQGLYGALLTALAVADLRPSFRARAGGTRRRPPIATRGPSWLRRTAWRVPCGDDPMLWKELVVPRLPVFYRPLGLSMGLILAGLLAWGTIDFAIPAFQEVWVCGYGPAPAGSARDAFHDYLQIVGTGIALVVALGVASDAAAAIAAEREKDTWISLLATPLTGAEIVRGKMLGAFWGTRHMGVVLGLLGIVGSLAGSLHPLGLVLALFELVAFTGFAAALGIWISLRTSDTMRALTRVMTWLLAVSGGSLLVGLPLLSYRPLALVGCPPALLAASLGSCSEVLGQGVSRGPGWFRETRLSELWLGHGTEMVVASLASVLGYALGAWTLTRSACRGFDAQLDRPPVSAAVVDERSVGRRAARVWIGFMRKARRSGSSGVGSRNRLLHIEFRFGTIRMRRLVPTCRERACSGSSLCVSMQQAASPRAVENPQASSLVMAAPDSVEVDQGQSSAAPS
jgi:ABC-type transport system involved in multi-copper enzyme maturation permease subunit